MRVPLEIICVILEWAEVELTLRELFALRLVNKLFEKEVLSVSFSSGRLDKTFKSFQYQTGWRKFPRTLQEAYIRFRIRTHWKRPSILSTLFFRSFEVQIKIRGIASDDENAKAVFIEGMINWTDWDVLGGRYPGQSYVAFAQGASLQYWLRVYDKCNFRVYTDVEANIRLYLLLRYVRGGLNWVRRRQPFHAIADMTNSPDLHAEFAQDVLRFMITEGNSLSEILQARTMQALDWPALVEPVLIAARLGNPYMVQCLMSRVLSDDVGIHQYDQTLLALAHAVIRAVEVDEPETARYIIECLGYGKSPRTMHELFREIWGEGYNERHRYFLTEDCRSKLRTMVESGQHKVRNES